MSHEYHGHCDHAHNTVLPSPQVWRRCVDLRRLDMEAGTGGPFLLAAANWASTVGQCADLANIASRFAEHREVSVNGLRGTHSQPNPIVLRYPSPRRDVITGDTTQIGGMPLYLSAGAIP